jgi:putative ABC transport system ATP-binding protein
MLEIKNLKKSYFEAQKEIEIFENLNITFEQKTKNIILGSSGSGKSTFLNLISSLDNPNSGKILFNGVDICSLNESQKTLYRRKNIGFIFQFFNLIPTLSVKENIFLPLELNGLLNDEYRTYVLSLLDNVGLLDRLETMPENLSGGQQQRVAIVRALAHKPKLIIADEPTGNLDLETASNIIKIIVSLIDETNTTLIIATHDKKLQDIADNVYSVEHKSLIKVQNSASL